MVCRKAALFLIVVITALFMTGCSSYKAGKVTDGVYSNSLFKVTTPKGFKYYTGDEVGKVGHYAVCYGKALGRGADKSFKCEYAADSGVSEILVASEDNISKCTLDEFAETVGKQMESDLLDFSVIENKDVTVNGAAFRKLECFSEGCHITYFITEQGNKFVYVYVLTLDSDLTDSGEKALSSISAP